MTEVEEPLKTQTLVTIIDTVIWNYNFFVELKYWAL